MLDARVAEETRVLQDTLAREEEHALLRHALAEPPSHAKVNRPHTTHLLSDLLTLHYVVVVYQGTSR